MRRSFLQGKVKLLTGGKVRERVRKAPQTWCDSMTDSTVWMREETTPAAGWISRMPRFHPFFPPPLQINIQQGG